MTGSAYNSMPMNMAIKLEDSLQAAGFSREDVEEAKRFSRQGHTGLTEGLLKRNVLGEQDLLVLIGEIYGIPFRPDLSADHLDLDYTGKTPIQYLKKFKVVPLISPAAPRLRSMIRRTSRSLTT